MRLKKQSFPTDKNQNTRHPNPFSVDVMILYEHRTRELENACLLAAELMRRGLKVSIEYMTSLGNFLTKANVIVVPHLYDDYQVCFMTKSIWGEYPRVIVDLQSEQVLSKSGDKDGRHCPTGQAKKAHHIAWGQAQVKKYLNAGISPNHIHMTGHIAMDFLKDGLRAYFFSKEQIAKQFNLDPNREWVLFLSSFSYANRTEDNLRELQKMFSGARQLNEVTMSTREKIAEWFEAAVLENPDKLFIYRPHPAEKRDQLFIDLERNYENFFCIRDFSSKQWVLVSNRLYTWFSTSVVDAYFAHKICYVLRPVEMPSTLDNPLLEKCHHIKTKNEFLASLSDKEKHNEQYLDSKEIEFFYGRPDNGFAYQKIANLCEEAITCPAYRYNYTFSGYRFSPSSSFNKKIAVKAFLVRCLASLCTHVNLKVFFRRLKRLRKYQHFEKELYGLNKEIKVTTKRLIPFVENNKDIL